MMKGEIGKLFPHDPDSWPYVLNDFIHFHGIWSPHTSLKFYTADYLVLASDLEWIWDGERISVMSVRIDVHNVTCPIRVVCNHLGYIVR